MILLLDIGNTRLKWAQLERDAVGPQQAAVHAGWTAGQVDSVVLAALPPPRRVLVANVGGAAIGAAVRDAVAQRWGIEVEQIVSTAAAAGVSSAYSQPANLGVDRWLAIIAAHAMTPGGACVVSIGTAMTIDGIDAKGRHLGGVIVPGPELMVAAVLRNTSDVASRAASGTMRAGVFADNTFGAVRQGSTHALAALIERAVDTMTAELGAVPALLIAGGAMDQVVSLVRRTYTVVPDLVLRGLAVLAREPG